jgi:hypothetical protein
MSKRYWITAIAFGLAIAVGSAVHGQQGQENDGGRQTQTDHRTTDQSSWSIPIHIVEDDAEAEARQGREERAEQRELDDLAAQEGMNEATQKMAEYSFVQTVLIAIGTGALIYTLYLTRQANNAAMQAAEAAIRAANAERAWVTFDSFDSGQLTNITIDGVHHERGFAIIPRWRNTGRSPAVRVDVYVDHRVVSVADPVPYFEPPPASEDRHGIFGPGVDGTGSWRVISGDTFDRIKAGELKWFVYSKVKYGTTLDPDSVNASQMCALVDFNGERIEDGELRPNVGLTFIGPQNTAT